MRIFKVLVFFGVIISFICCAQDIQFEYKLSEKTQIVEIGVRDILFVVDNSCSMIQERNELAEKFGEFVQFLEKFQLSWRVGLTDTELGREDSELLPFGEGGPYFLDSNTSNYASLFQQSIQAIGIRQACRSDGTGGSALSRDERGTYVVNKILDRDPNSFFRPNTRLAVVFISDEDVRSGLYRNNSDKFQLEEQDRPENLVLKIREVLGSKTVVSFHSIIVLEEDVSGNNYSGDCENENYQEKNIGSIYYRLSQPPEFIDGDERSLLNLGSIIQGTVESICNQSYSNFYSNLAYHLEEREIHIPCKGKMIEAIEVQTHDDLEPLSNGLDYEVDRDKGIVKFNENIRSDRKITVETKCI